jgi:hypothetical protein
MSVGMSGSRSIPITVATIVALCSAAAVAALLVSHARQPAVAATKSQVPAKRSSPGGSRTYASAKGFSVSVPPNWSVVEVGALEDESGFTAAITKGVGKGTNVIIDRMTSPPRTLARYQAQSVRSELGSADEIVLRDRPLPGKGSVPTVEYLIPFGAGKAVQRHYFFPSGEKGTTFYVSATVPANLDAKLSGVIEQIAASVTLGTTGLETKPFVDPTGDAAGAPDIRTVAASEDTNDNLSFKIELAHAPARADTVGVSINSDNDRKTGNISGFDYLIAYENGNPSLLAWNGKSLKPVPGRVEASSSDGKLSFTLKADTIGNPRTFLYYAWSQTGDAYGDDAPDGRDLLTYITNR